MIGSAGQDGLEHPRGANTAGEEASTKVGVSSPILPASNTKIYGVFPVILKCNPWLFSEIADII
jgi:hypothetical protein